MLTRTIKIDPMHWARINNRQREELMFHELTHCVCGYFHDDAKKENNCPASIMNTYGLPKKCLRNHWKEYMMDLRNICRGLKENSFI